MNKNIQLNFHNQKIQFNYRGDDDITVIEEFFVDKMYRSTESIIIQTTNPVLDIGAHIGCFSIYARKLNPHSPILVIEPEPNNFSLLKENLKLNHCNSIITKQMALVGTDKKIIELYLNEDSHNHSTFYKTEKSISVPATTLEEIINKNKLDKIGILKIDIEGEEFSVIKNLKLDTWNIIETIILEYHDFRGNDHNDLTNIIRSKGFSIEHFPNHYNKRFGLLVCRNKNT